MGMKANDVGDWLRRQHVGKRDHHEALRDDVVVIRPGPNFDLFMGTLAAGPPAPPALEHGQSSEDRRQQDERDLLHLSQRLKRIGTGPVAR
jgi:hypothetical protein